MDWKLKSVHGRNHADPLGWRLLFLGSLAALVVLMALLLLLCGFSNMAKAGEADRTKHALFLNVDLQGFKVPDSVLPQQARIVGRSSSFYRQYKGLVWNVTLVFGLMTTALLGLGYGLVRSRRADLSPGAQPDGSPSANLIGILNAKILEQGSSFVEWLFRGLDGREFPATILATRMELGDRTIFQGTVRDITERRRAEEFLRKSEERFELAMAVANEGIWDWDLKTGKDLFDDRYYTMAGYEPGEFPGILEEWKKRVHPDDIGKAQDAIDMYLAGTIPAYKVEFRFRKKDGTWMWIMARGRVVSRDEEGSPVRFVGTHSDITELKQTEKALRRAQKMEAVGQLTGGIAHDFNNILGVIIGNLDLLTLHAGSNKKARKRIGSARKAAIRAADLTKQLLGFSRTQAEHVAVTDINRVIRDMGNLIGRSLTPEVVVEYSLEKNLWLTGIDLGYFEDALLNLVLNARDAMPGGINGYELAEEACARYPHLKVLLTSGFTAKATARNARAGFNSNLLSKPYTQADMATRVRAVLGENPQSRVPPVLDL